MINDRDMIELSTIHAYGKYSQNDKFTVNGNEYEVVDVYNEDSGMKYGTDAMLVKSDESYALIYIGSDRKTDFFKDWILNNGANLLKLDVSQYKEGNELYKTLSKKFDIEAVGGVSLGGGVAIYVGINNSNVRAVSINPSPQVCDIGTSYKNITTIIDKNDILFNAANLFGRRNNYPKNLMFFERGNSFLKNIAFNHVGYNEKLSLDDRVHFDLLTNSNKHIIKINVDDVSVINNNFKTYYNNLYDEINLTSLNQIKSVVSLCRDDIKYNKILNEVILQVKNYMKNTLPTLYSYLDFESFFSELEVLINKCSFELLDAILNLIVKELNLDVINDQLLLDAKLSISNLSKINSCTNTNVKGCTDLINSIKNVDENSVGGHSYASKLNLINGKTVVRLNYSYLIERAKNFLYFNLKTIISKYFYAIDYKLDEIIGILKLSVGVLSDVSKLVSKEISRKLEVIETVLQELYVFNVKDIVYVSVVSIIDELVSIVVVKDLDEKIFAFKTLNSSINSLSIMYQNYKCYLDEFSSRGITKLGVNLDNITHELKKFGNHLNFVYK